MSDIPKSINIGGYDYRIEVVDDLRGENGALLYGQVIYSTCTIKVDRSHIDGPRLLAIIWHEVLHAALEQAACPENERIISILGLQIPALIAANPFLAGGNK